jgi:hypothetical protein
VSPLAFICAAAFFGGFFMLLGAAVGIGVSLWVAGHIVRWLEQKGLIP